MVRVLYTGKYLKTLGELVSVSPDIEGEIDQRVMWFVKNPEDTRLGNHELTGRMEGKWAFRIRDDIRVVYEWMGKSTARFLAIGGHTKVYRRN